MRSMTGFGSGEASSDTVKISVEMTAVNRKQADIVINLPRSIAELETKVKKKIAGRISRGRVSTYVTLEPMGEGLSGLEVDDNLAREYFNAIKLLGKVWGSELDLKPSDLLRAPGVFAVKELEVTPEDVEPLLFSAVGKALDQLIGMQDAEGDALKTDLMARLDSLRTFATDVTALAPKVKEHYHAQLHRRIQESDIDLSFDDDRLLKEIGIFAERCDITEELTRLGSHFEQFGRYFESNDPSGRALDFLCQEVNRELNTIGSKANDAAIAQKVVEAKTELEKIREQVQNVQ